MYDLTQCHNGLEQHGLFKIHFPVEDEVISNAMIQDWKAVDRHFNRLTSCDGAIFKFLSNFQKFSSMEFIISLRDSANEWEEDGIWHDDGSRTLAFSYSLLDHKDICGGQLLFRKKGEENGLSINAPSSMEMIVFRTGVFGYEHKVTQVTKGRRLIVAGWCS